MDKLEIEDLMSERARQAVEDATAKCIEELNQEGCNFVVDQGSILQWIDGESGKVLSVNCSLGVALDEADEGQRSPDPATDAFITAASSGQDPLATVLNLAEGDLANGGFSLLFVNKDVAYVREAITGLERIGAHSTAGLVVEALVLFEQHLPIVDAYDGLMQELQQLDQRIEELPDDIPTLFHAYQLAG